MKSIIVKVQIQLDQYGDEDSAQYVMDKLNEMNSVIQQRFNDVCPQIFCNNIDSSDIEVTEQED